MRYLTTHDIENLSRRCIRLGVGVENLQLELTEQKEVHQLQDGRLAPTPGVIITGKLYGCLDIMDLEYQLNELIPVAHIYQSKQKVLDGKIENCIIFWVEAAAMKRLLAQVEPTTEQT